MNSMSPRLQMLTAFAAAALNARMAKEDLGAVDKSELCALCWYDAIEMMRKLPPQAQAELTVSVRAYGNDRRVFPDQG